MKTLVELRNENEQKMNQDTEDLAQRIVSEVDEKIAERKKWAARRQMQIVALEALLGQLDTALISGNHKEVRKISKLVTEASGENR